MIIHGPLTSQHTGEKSLISWDTNALAKKANYKILFLAHSFISYKALGIKLFMDVSDNMNCNRGQNIHLGDTT